MTQDGRHVIAADVESVAVWDVDVEPHFQRFEGHVRWVRAVAPTPDGRRVVSASQDRTVRLWDIESGTVLETLAAPDPDITRIVVAPPEGS